MRPVIIKHNATGKKLKDIFDIVSVCMYHYCFPHCHGFKAISKNVGSWVLLLTAFETTEKLNSGTYKNCMCTAGPFMFFVIIMSIK